MIAEAFLEHEIVPDVLASDPPLRSFSVKFDSGVKAFLGNVLTPTQVKNQPHVEWEAESDAFYTLINIDPDAPSRKEPIRRESHHWLVVNIPGNDVSKGDVLSEYIGPGPPLNTGLHRYIYLVYKQNGRIEDPEHGRLSNKTGHMRGCWKTAKFVAKHNLGKPVFGNFFQAEYDDYVPIVHKLSRP